MIFGILYLFGGLVYVFCAEHCTYVLHVPLIELTFMYVMILLLLVQVFSFCWLVSPFIERNNFIAPAGF